MKIRFSLLLITISLIAGCAKPGIVLQDYEPEQIIHYSQMQNVENLSDSIVYLNAGDSIPVKMTLDSELFDITHEDIHLILKQKLFFRTIIPERFDTEDLSAMSEQERQRFYKSFKIYLSPDSKQWALYTDIKAIEQIFGIKGGTFSFGMGLTKEEGLKLILSTRINSQK